MIFRELVLQNFGPYGGRHVIDLTPEVKNPTRPIILFGGMNGGGKTTLMDALRLALYGQRAQCSTRRSGLSYGDFLSQCVHTHTPAGDSTRVELVLEHIRHDQWVELRIVRSWTKFPKEGKDQLGILESDWPDAALANMWDEYIENLFPIGISNLFLFDGEQVMELADLDAPPESVKAAISTLLGLELADRLDADLDVLVSRKRKVLASESQLVDLEVLEDKLKVKLAAKEQAQEQLKACQEDLQLKQKNYNHANHQFRIEGGKIAAQKSQLQTQINGLNLAAQEQRQRLRDLAASWLPLQLILPLLEGAQQQASTELQDQENLIARNILLKRDQELLSYLCSLALSHEQLQKIKAFLDEQNQELDSKIANSTAPYLGITSQELKQLNNVLENQLPSATKSAAEIITLLEEIALNIESYERQLAIAASPEAYEKLNAALELAQQQLVKAESAYQLAKQRLEQSEKAIASLKKELQSYTEQALARQNNEHLIQSVGKVKQTLQLFKERLTLKKLNKLETEVTECFRYLLHKSDLVHRVGIDSQQFSLSLYDGQGLKVPKHRLSAGEKQLLAIAFLWGLARVSGRHLPIAVDTPLGRLDSSHRQNLLERYFPSASHQVILLSTDTEIGSGEVESLRKAEAIAKEYILKYNSQSRQTHIEPGYFW